MYTRPLTAARPTGRFSPPMRLHRAQILGIRLPGCCPRTTFRYSFQPNRTLRIFRERAEEFCRKLDEGSYDVEYANRQRGKIESRFSRNWIGEALVANRYNASYKTLFRARFHSLAHAADLACRSYKAKYGKFPAALSDLVPEFLREVPRDPFDGEELRYDAAGLYIWTRGAELSFDGGGKVSTYKHRWIHHIAETR